MYIRWTFNCCDQYALPVLIVSMAFFIIPTALKFLVTNPSWSYGVAVLILSMDFFIIPMVKKVHVYGHGFGGSRKGGYLETVYKDAA